MSAYKDGEYFDGEIEVDQDGDVEGHITLDDGTEIDVEGEMDGYGEAEVYGDDGEYYELEIDE